MINIYTEASYISLHVSYSQISSDNKNNAQFHLILGAIDCKM